MCKATSSSDQVNTLVTVWRVYQSWRYAGGNLEGRSKSKHALSLLINTHWVTYLRIGNPALHPSPAINWNLAVQAKDLKEHLSQSHSCSLIWPLERPASPFNRSMFQLISAATIKLCTITLNLQSQLHRIDFFPKEVFVIFLSDRFNLITSVVKILAAKN